MGGMVGLFFLTIVITGIAKPKVVFFPSGDPMYIYAYIKMPVGTDVKVTDSITKVVEKRVRDVVGKNNPVVESIISNVSLGASESMFDRSSTSNKGKVTVSFVEASKRVGVHTSMYLDSIRKYVRDIPGAEITVDGNKMGPAAGKPINIEVTGDDMDELIKTASAFKKYIEAMNIPGIEQLKSDLDVSKPELIVRIDRERANREGISTGQIGMELRTSVLGKEISKYREDEDQYPIQLKYSEDYRKNIDKLMDLKITYRDMNSGLLKQIPLSVIAKVEYVNTYGSINRKNLKRVITISSNVLSGYNATEIINKINKSIPSFNKSEDIDIQLTGEKEDMKDATTFLTKAMILALCLILFILITQFNSIGKTVIILSEVVFSIIGVLLGFIICGMDISVIMTGMGVVALAGIVVRNGILLVEFTDVLKARGLKTRDAIIQAGKTRITPVILTATATILGLVPLAIGFNINFGTLFANLNPHIYFGGDNTRFFGSLTWTIIFGLSFATFLTLVFIPAMYLIMYEAKTKLRKSRLHKAIRGGKYEKEIEVDLSTLEMKEL
jgi:multidrug efflux pump subunit AcrB